VPLILVKAQRHNYYSDSIFTTTNVASQKKLEYSICMLYYVNYYMYTTFILTNMYITFTLNNVNIQSEHLFCLAFCAYVS